jgi:hypothetical protein
MQDEVLDSGTAYQCNIEVKCFCPVGEAQSHKSPPLWIGQVHQPQNKISGGVCRRLHCLGTLTLRNGAGRKFGATAQKFKASTTLVNIGNARSRNIPPPPPRGEPHLASSMITLQRAPMARTRSLPVNILSATCQSPDLCPLASLGGIL